MHVIAAVLVILMCLAGSYVAWRMYRNDGAWPWPPGR